MRAVFHSRVLHVMVLAGATVALLEMVRRKYRRKNNPRTVVEDMEMINSPWVSRLEVATALALQAGQAMLEATSVGVSHKGRHDLVTETDRSNEALIHRGLVDAFPSDGFLGEEASAERGGIPSELPAEDLTWIVDPIDGTTNFVHGFPVTCVSIGLARGEELLVGVVYNPMTRELYQGVKGSGAWLNGERLTASKTTDLDQAIVVTEYSYLREEESLKRMMETTGRITCRSRAVRQTGCGAMDLCFLARGAVDAIYGGIPGVWKPWDWAAGVLIAREAGAVVSNGEGEDFRLMGRTVVAAATLALSDSLVNMLVAAPHLSVEKSSSPPSST